MQEPTWPPSPLIPADWTDDSPYLPLVVTRISEGYCPKDLTLLSADDGYCGRCDALFSLVSSAGTIPTTNAIGPGVFPPWAITDGTTVMVSREPNWGCENAG
jgi:hypothetical protein